MGFIKVWGCLAYVRLPDIKIEKLGTHTTNAVFLGYAESSDARRFLNLEMNSIMEALDIEYFKEKLIKDKNIMLHDLQKISLRERTRIQNLTRSLYQ